MGNTSIKPDDVQNATLTDYFEYLYRSQLCFKRGQAEVGDITKAVSEMVNEITNEIGNIDRRFEISEVRFAGSMAEGTSNGEPDEFDFLVTVRTLSMSDDIFLTRDCNGKKGYVHVGIRERENSNLTDMWKDVVEKGKIKSTKNGIFQIDGFRDKFRVVLKSAVNIVKRRKITISKETGHLNVYTTDVENHGPACLFVFNWTSQLDTKGLSKELVISVDITPAIQFEAVEDLIDGEEVGNEMLYQRLKDAGVFMVISSGKQTCSDGLCFKLTFTNTELAIIHQMTEYHRKCYRILKYLFNGLVPKYVANIIFHSYALKTFVLRHHIDNACEGESRNLAKCIKEIIKEIETCLSKSAVHFFSFEIKLPCLFLPSLNIFDRTRDTTVFYSNEEGIRKMQKSLYMISNTDLADNEEKKVKQFEKFDLKIVNMYVPRTHSHSSRRRRRTSMMHSRHSTMSRRSRSGRR